MSTPMHLLDGQLPSFVLASCNAAVQNAKLKVEKACFSNWNTFPLASAQPQKQALALADRVAQDDVLGNLVEASGFRALDKSVLKSKDDKEESKATSSTSSDSASERRRQWRHVEFVTV
ncbi:hypothetical protein B0T24DRAFT_592571 [Lasiosphaeria ovina]|uniref:Uncharacterized protein n=1 Tax=Lasiosphaeria ovina TaxID=92902 RepID=A0AAE0KHP5_9PEZI|nr:hypothetical protein B0T24DRAFT_592571 [Lasiosphaeria ovina]